MTESFHSKIDAEGNSTAARNFRFQRALAAMSVSQLFNILSTILGLISVPLYLTWLGNERYGLLLTGLAYGGLLMFADAGLSWSSMLLIAQARGRDDKYEIANIVRASIILAFASSIVVVLIVAVLMFFLNSDLNFFLLPTHPEFTGIIVAVGFSTVVSLVFSAFYNVFIGFQEGHLAAFYQGIGRLLSIIIGLLTAASGASLGFILAANAFSSAAAGLFAAVHCVKRNPAAFAHGNWWQPLHFKQQLRAGMKSFAMQLGSILLGSAPIITISRISGAIMVPTFTVPFTLLNTPLNFIQSLNANLQASYADAVGGNDFGWIGETVTRMLKQSLIYLCILVSGFFVVANPFVSAWTSGKLIVDDIMLLSVACVASCLCVNSIFRFALSGMNRHKLTGISEIVFGLLSIVLAGFISGIIGPQFVGLGVFAAYMGTSGWILPLQLSKQLGGVSFFPRPSFILKLFCITLGTILTGKTFIRCLANRDNAFAIVTAAGIVTITFVFLFRVLLNEEHQKIVLQLRWLFNRLLKIKGTFRWPR
jgi:O-antigen/teichoic acid export membrane protein